MVLGPLFTLVGVRLIIKRRLFLVCKIDLESMLEESVFSAADKM